MSTVLGMSDEDFLKLNDPSEAEDVTPPVVTEDTPVDTLTDTVPAVDEQDVLDVPAVIEDDLDKSTVDEDLEGKADPEVPAGTVPEAGKNTVNPLVPEVPATQDTPVESVVTPADKEAFYDKAMAGFKANGKQIELRSPEELIQLAQMGCNYTAKMQQIAPHRKVLLMLENNGLLDEAKLSYLIDIDKKDPEAIKKLIKDSGLDPMDIDPSVEPTYREGNHRVGDEEVNFRTVLDDMRSVPKGVETLQVLNSTWDQASKDALFKNPDIMPIMHQQRELGIYDRIAAEIGRQKVLGAIPPNKPFVEAYSQVGKQMAEQGAFADLDAQQAPVVPAATPVATRTAVPKAAVVPNAKANAAAASRTTPRQAKVVVNPLAMSDDDFLKQFDGRL